VIRQKKNQARASFFSLPGLSANLPARCEHGDDLEYEALDLEKREPAVDMARCPHGHCGDALGVPLAIQRIVASALGASLGAIESACFGANLVAFALTIFVLGLVSIAFRLERVGYSYAGMTLAIIVLVPRPEVPWIAAVHRFAEVSLGILVALAVVAVWREKQRLLGGSTAE
jgi:Fusaric acid resistance protein-like